MLEPVTLTSLDIDSDTGETQTLGACAEMTPAYKEDISVVAQCMCRRDPVPAIVWGSFFSPKTSGLANRLLLIF